MALCCEFLPEFNVIVDLAVEDEPEGSVLVRHRLAGIFREVDDGKAAVGEGDSPFRVGSLAIRATVGDALRHRGNEPLVRQCVPVTELPRNPAHYLNR